MKKDWYIEVCVVICIVGLLVVLALPSFIKASNAPYKEFGVDRETTYFIVDPKTNEDLLPVKVSNIYYGRDERKGDLIVEVVWTAPEKEYIDPIKIEKIIYTITDRDLLIKPKSIDYKKKLE